MASSRSRATCRESVCCHRSLGNIGATRPNFAVLIFEHGVRDCRGTNSCVRRLASVLRLLTPVATVGEAAARPRTNSRHPAWAVPPRSEAPRCVRQRTVERPACRHPAATSIAERASLRLGCSSLRRTIVIYTIALVLLILWVLGLVTAFTAGGLLHILLVVAVVLVLYQLISGRRVG